MLIKNKTTIFSMILLILGMKRNLLISTNVFYEHFINRKGFKREGDTVLFIPFYGLYGQ